MKICFSDTETYCDTPIGVGTHRYAEHVEVTVWAYALDNGPVKVWDLTDGSDMPADLAAAVADRDTIFVWHNAHFDSTVLQHAKVRINGQLRLANIPPDRHRCTMARALAHGLPGSLDTLGQIFGIDEDQKKLRIGRTLVLRFCKPQGKFKKRYGAETHPEDWAMFLSYAGQDVEAMRAIAKKMPNWNLAEGSTELELWLLDQKINNRGVMIDIDLCRAAVQSAESIKEGLNERTSELTDGQVSAASKRDQMIQHLLEAHNITLPNLQVATVEKALNNEWLDLPPVVRELLELRISSSRTSAKKYNTMINAVSKDFRLRGMLQFCGAARTGRWAGRVVQPQNFSRVPKYLKKQYDHAIDAIKADAVDLIFENPMEVLGACIRGALVAPRGKKLVISDLSNIEGRVLAWESGETWKLQAFRDFDTIIGTDAKGEPIRKGDDLYKLAYAKSFNTTPDQVDDDQRQVGKVQELALGFGGGVGAFVTFAATYGIDLEELARMAIPNVPSPVLAQAISAYDWAVKQGRTYGLSREVYVACDALKRLWRIAHPETVAWWNEVDMAARAAVMNPGKPYVARRVTFVREKAWLRLILPSGRSLCYPSPQIVDGVLSYMGTHQTSRKWCRIGTYYGKLVENATQAIARDVMAHAMPIAEKAGYAILLSIHDELITETYDNPAYHPSKLSNILATNPKWATDLPLAAAGFETYRYRKE